MNNQARDNSAEFLSRSLAKRRSLLSIISWCSVMVWPALSVVAYLTRPLENYTVVGLAVFSLLCIYYAVSLHWQDEHSFYVRSRQFIATYMAALLLQTANVLFGSTEYLYLSGQVPLVSAGYQIICVFAYVMLERHYAALYTRIFSFTLAFIILAHVAIRWSHFESYYALSLMIANGIFLVVATLLLIRMYIDLHSDAISMADEKIEQQRIQLDQATRDEKTGVLTAQAMRQHLGQLMQSDNKFGLLAFQLQDEEQLRARLGHESINQILVAAAAELTTWAGKPERVARGGHNELYVRSRFIHLQSALEETGLHLRQQLNQRMQELFPQEQMNWCAAGSIRDDHLDASFLMEETSFRLFMATIRDDYSCFVA